MNGNSGPCGACKFLRRKCVKACVFAPYFEPDERGTTDFEAVHRVFGAKNVAKILLKTPPNHRLDAVVSLCYEALSRVRDPVYGCVAQVFYLHQQVDNLQAQLAYVQARLSMLKDGRRSLCDSSPTSHVTQQGSCISGAGSPELVQQETASCCEVNNNVSFGDHEVLFEDIDFELLARELLTNCLKTRPSSSP